MGTLRELIQTLKDRTSEEYDFDAMVVITGDKGIGKNTLSIHIAKGVDSRFNFERNYAWTREEAIEKLKSKDIKSIVIDEAIYSAYVRDWANKGQREFSKFINIARVWRKVSVWNIPNFPELDSHFRKHFTFWIWIPIRGYAVVMTKIKNPFSSDPWLIKQNEKTIFKKVKRAWDIDEVIRIVQKSPNYVDYFEFGPLDEETDKLYKEYSFAKKTELSEFAVEEEKEKMKKSAEWVNRTYICAIVYRMILRSIVGHHKIKSIDDIAIDYINRFSKEKGYAEIDYETLRRYFQNRGPEYGIRIQEETKKIRGRLNEILLNKAQI